MQENVESLSLDYFIKIEELRVFIKFGKKKMNKNSYVICFWYSGTLKANC